MSLHEYWQTKFPEMRPVPNPPRMATVNGIGTMLYGGRDYDDESHTHVKTLCFTLVFLPIFTLGAYRVADAPQGWYFIGRVPLSGFARAWNFLVLIGIAVGIGTVAWITHSHNPETIAAGQLQVGDQMATAGQPGQAAQQYRQVAVGSTKQTRVAFDKLQNLIDHHLDDADAEEAAAALQVAADLHQFKGRPDKVFDRGLEQARRRSDRDVRGAWKILAVVEPLAMQDPELLIVKHGLLEQVVALEPDNMDAVSSLAMLWETKRDYAQCEALLSKNRTKLGGREGARILGQIYARQGKLDDAVVLLQAYTDERLQRLQTAEQRFASLAHSVEGSAIDTLKKGKAPDFNFNRYKSLDRRQQDAMVNDYILDKIRSSPDYFDAQQAIRRETAVVPVALDLGIVLLRRGQSMKEPKARQQELEKAEKTFLAVRETAGKTDEYRLSLGQVSYWLGKHEQGRKLFDELLTEKGRDSKSLASVARILREVGAVSEARALLEEAFDKETDVQLRNNVARERAVMHRDADDRIAWLEKIIDPDRSDRAELAGARGDKALLENRDAEAIQLLQEALSHYGALPESAAVLNNSALVHFSLFQVTGNHDDLNAGIAKMEKAIALSPRDSILVSNAAHTIFSNAIWEIAGATLERKTLRSAGDLDLLAFIYNDKAGRDQLAAKVREHPAVAKARELYERELLLAPKREYAYRNLAKLYDFCGDVDGLRQLNERLKETELDQADANRRHLEDMQGKNDDKLRNDLRDGLARLENVRQKAQEQKGTTKGTTLAVALTNLSRIKMAALSMNMKAEAADMVELAEEAYRLAPSDATRSQLMFALLARAHAELKETNKKYGELAAQVKRSLHGGILIAIVVSEDAPARKACLEHADVKRALMLLAQDAVLTPETASEWTWALLRNTDPQIGDRLGQFLLKHERSQLLRSIYRKLQPLDATEAYQQYWLCLLQGDPEKARAVAQEYIDKGVPMPLVKAKIASKKR